MTTTSLTIERADGSDITVDAFVERLWTAAVGETATIRCLFDQNSPTDKALIVPSGDSTTISTTTQRQYAVVDGDLTVSGDLTIESNGAYALRRYIYAAAGVHVRRGADHTVTYHERIPGGSGLQSLALRVVPSEDLVRKGVAGVWGVVTGGRDARNSNLTRDVVELDLAVLARAEEYADHAALESDLKTRGEQK